MMANTLLYLMITTFLLNKNSCEKLLFVPHNAIAQPQESSFSSSYDFSESESENYHDADDISADIHVQSTAKSNHFTTQQRSFVVDLDQKTFLKDGKPYSYISGSFHYFRTPRVYWRDRLEKLYAAGLDTVQIYIPWNVHEPTPGTFDFSGDNDLEAFLQLADDIGLLVIVRAGPYICAEWEFGGFPWWLLVGTKPNVLRTLQSDYIEPVDKWMSVLLPKIKNHLYHDGGPVIMVQVENEYGSYFACDHGYMTHLRELFRSHLGDDVVLFTTDGYTMNYLKCGTEPQLLPTVDFGPSDNITANFEDLRKFDPNSILVNSEYYVGWFDSWGGGHARPNTEKIVQTLQAMLDMQVNVNMYMFVGGTNFGYMNGAPNNFQPVTTSYDYAAPISEGGDTMPTYHAIRDLIAKYRPSHGPVPENIPAHAYEPVVVRYVGSVIHMDTAIASTAVWSTYPLHQERFSDTGYGFMVYRKYIWKNHTNAMLNVSGIRDSGYVFINGQYVGLVDRTHNTSLPVSTTVQSTVSIIVENQGRIGFTNDISNNTKGIIHNVTLDGDLLEKWEMLQLNFSLVNTTQHSHSSQETPNGPSVYEGSFVIQDKPGFPQDTYIHMDGWTKGQIFINGHNLGRYWPIQGPQVTLYLPACYLNVQPHINTVMIVELRGSPCFEDGVYQPSKCTVQFSDSPIFKSQRAEEMPAMDHTRADV